MSGTYSISGTQSISATPLPHIPSLPNLQNISLEGLTTLFNSFSSFSPLEIKGALNTLTSAALQKGNGSFSVKTDTFSLQSKTLSSEPLLLPRLSLPPLGLPPGSFASTIEWTTNPYDDSSNPVVSINALAPNASEIRIHSLTKPFTTSWSIDTPIYTFFCDQDIVLVKKGNTYASPPNVTKVSPTTWSVPCGTTFRNVSCPIQTYACPTADCVYWNTSLSAWSSDGCTKEISGSKLLCHCTHMTDFSVRLQGIASENAKVFAIAGSVYSEEGLVLYAKWYSIFGTLAFCTLLLVILATWLDFPLRKLYVDILMKTTKFKPILERAPYTPVYRYNSYSSLKLYKELDLAHSAAAPTFNPCRRMCIQHSYLQAMVRFDPRLNRSFRILFLMMIQFHSLFVTAFLYGFSFGSKGLTAADTIALSLLTSLVTVPCVRLGLYYLNTVGLKEFEYQFPMLYNEYMRRVEFETIAAPLFKIAAATAESEDLTGNAGEEIEETLFLRMFNWIVPTEQKKEERVDRATVLKELAKCIQKEYPKFTTYSLVWELLPCHTVSGWAFLLLSFGWIGWCLQYLLLFAASHSAEVGDGILISYGTSELVTIFLSQPLTVLLMTGFFIFSHRHKEKLPWPLSLLGSVTTKHSIPSIYYFSNPLNHHTYTILSSEFAHSIFLDAASKAMGADILATAPIKSILSTINEEEEIPDRRVEELYYSMVKYYTQKM